METYNDLWELTRQESGAIQYDGDDIIITNWVTTKGLPRIFGTIEVGLAETLTATPTDPPQHIIDAMLDHEGTDRREFSHPDDYKAWRVNDEATVVTCINWN